MNLFRKWSSREYSLPLRLLALIIPGFLLVFLIPYLLLVSLLRLDVLAGFSRIDISIGNLLAGVVLVTCGLFFAWWSIGDQLFVARGTPLPVMPTQRLLITGPFRYCRNPMTLGTILAYLGLAIWVGSIFSLVLVLIIAILLVLYLKTIEEHELEMRFGQDYLDYKKSTSFLIPRSPGKQKE